MNLKSLLLGGLVSVSSLFTGVGEAQATYCYDRSNGGYTCIHRVMGNRSGTEKTVWYSHDGGQMKVMDVYCNPAYRYNYKANLAGIACYEYN